MAGGITGGITGWLVAVVHLGVPRDVGSPPLGLEEAASLVFCGGMLKRDALEEPAGKGASEGPAGRGVGVAGMGETVAGAACV
jgi:hypothetical protein